MTWLGALHSDCYCLKITSKDNQVIISPVHTAGENLPNVNTKGLLCSPVQYWQENGKMSKWDGTKDKRAFLPRSINPWISTYPAIMIFVLDCLHRKQCMMQGLVFILISGAAKLKNACVLVTTVPELDSFAFFYREYNSIAISHKWCTDRCYVHDCGQHQKVLQCH